jgi:hypothetical protein
VSTTDSNFAAVRYNDNGSLDTGFGDAGKRTYEIDGNDFSFDMLFVPSNPNRAQMVGGCIRGGVTRTCALEIAL